MRSPPAPAPFACEGARLSPGSSVTPPTPETVMLPLPSVAPIGVPSGSSSSVPDSVSADLPSPTARKEAFISAVGLPVDTPGPGGPMIGMVAQELVAVPADVVDAARDADDEVLARGDEPGVGETIEPHDTRVECQHQVVAGQTGLRCDVGDRDLDGDRLADRCHRLHRRKLNLRAAAGGSAAGC